MDTEEKKVLARAIEHMDDLDYGDPVYNTPPVELKQQLESGRDSDLQDVRRVVQDFVEEQFSEEVKTFDSAQDLRSNKTWSIAKDLISIGGYESVERELLAELSGQGIYLKVFEVQVVVFDDSNGGSVWVDVKANEIESASEQAEQYLEEHKNEVAQKLDLHGQISLDVLDSEVVEESSYKERDDLPAISRTERDG